MSVFSIFGWIVAVLLFVGFLFAIVIGYQYFQFRREEKKEGRVGYSTEWGK